MDQIQPQNRSQPKATGYTNLNQYLGANRSNQLGQTVSNGVQQAGQAATGAVNQAGQNFQQGVQSEQNRLAQSGQQVANTLGNLGNVQDSDVSNFQSALSGQGKGPAGLDNASDLKNKAQSAQQLGQATGSELGRYGLLQRYVGRGQQYGLGQQVLDSALLGQTGQNQLRQARSATAGLGQQANQAISAANAQGQELSNQAGQLKQSAQQQLGGAVTGYDASMASKLAADKAAQQSLISQLSGKGTNEAINLDPTVLGKLSTASGGVLNEGTQLYNADLSPYLQANNLYANNQAVQNSDDFLKAQALGKLAGNTGLAGTAQNDVLQSYLSNPTAVGQYDANSPLSISSNSGISDAIHAAAAAYQNQLNPLQTQLNNTINSGKGGTGIGTQLSQEQLQNLIANYTQGGNFGMLSGQAQNGYEGGVSNLQEAQNALNANLGQQASLNQQMQALGPQFNILRTLKGQQPAQNNGAIVGEPLNG